MQHKNAHTYTHPKLITHSQAVFEVAKLPADEMANAMGLLAAPC